METFGVVIWGDSSDGSLLILCADSGRLAYAGGSSSELPDTCEIGDIVNVMTSTDHQGRRFCTKVSTHVSERAYLELPPDMRAAADLFRNAATAAGRFSNKLHPRNE